jgi:hypothetical protein
MLSSDRGSIDVEDLLKIVLVLVALWLVVEIVEAVFGVLAWVVGPLQPFIGLVVVVLIVLWLLDRI